MTVPLSSRLGGFAYGGDYNPEQWPRPVWEEDVALMREAGVNLVTVGVFSWALLQPAPGEWDFGWLDEVIDLLHGNGIAVDLATATASPPPWFSIAHPEAALVDAAGVRRSHGARQAFCPSSAAFRDAAGRLVTAMAERYAGHPGVVMWHVSNEYACHNYHCYCDGSAAAFRDWLRDRYGTVAILNDAWGTAFWSQRYGDWDQILPPRAVSYSSFANPGQQLDWWRFSSGEHVRLFDAEARILRRHSDLPVTTNFMSFFKPLDYWDFAGHVDLVSNDDYLIADDPSPQVGTAMAADLMRSLASGRPWLLMEHSTSAVNWQPRNVAKAPGQLRRNSLQHLARGADGALFFQWRASRAGAEKFHSAMLPHAGTDSKIWREVREFGAQLGALAEVAGSVTEPPATAIVHDWNAWWAAELDSHPSAAVSPAAERRRWYEALWNRGIGTDFVHPAGDLSAYRLVVVPCQYLVVDDHVAALAAFVAGGGTAVVTYFSGIADENDHVRLGGYPGAYRELLGVRIEEFAPLLDGRTETLSDGARVGLWTELGTATTAGVLSSYASGVAAGSPATTVNALGAGHAFYLGTWLPDDAFDALLGTVLERAGVTPAVPGLPPGVEAVRRLAEGRSWLFLINHTDAAVDVPVTGHDLLGGAGGPLVRLEAGGATVLREEP